MITLSNAYPYISQFKKPQWYPFSLKKMIPDFYIPYFDELLKYYKTVANHLFRIPSLNLENIYWFLIMGRYFKINITKLNMVDRLYDFVTKCAVETSEYIGFKFTPNQKKNIPDTWSTGFALVILRLIGKLGFYLRSRQDVSIKKKILNFILNCRTKKRFLHCLDKCSICKKTSQYKALYSILESILALNLNPQEYANDILPMLEALKDKSSFKNIFRIIDLKYFGIFKEVSEEDFGFLLGFQKKDGGFSFTSKVKGSVNETFWTVYAFENYKFLAEYPRGNVYAFLINHLKRINSNKDYTNALKLMEYAKIIVILSIVWKNLIEDLEDIIFNELTDSPVMNSNILSIKGGVRNADYEIIAFINLKYKLSLDLLDNNTRFTQFISRLTPLEKHFAVKIYKKIKQYVRIDLTEILKSYNKGKVKKLRISIDFLRKLVDRMKEEHFFTGKLIEKRKFLRKYYYFDKDQYIPKIITSNRMINIDDINAEKKKLIDVKEDIYNMVREMKDSSQNIMREVESLIFAEEIEYAEKRLKTNIKKAYMDAEFFNKTIKQAVENFEYINATDALKEEIKDWNKVYKNLKADFENVNSIMLQKIKESEKLQNQKDLLEDLESLITNNTADIGLSFDMFKDSLRSKLEHEFSRNTVKNIQSELENIIDKISENDRKIVDYSQQITVDDRKVKKKRKKVINTWVSYKESFDEMYTFYLEGFQKWHDELENIDNFHKKYLDQINELKTRINNFVADRDYDAAYGVVEDGFESLLKDLDNDADSIEKGINKLLKKRKKLYLLFIHLENEVNNYKSILEDRINQIRIALKKQIELDQKRQMKEDFIILVNNKIDYLNDALYSLEKQMTQSLKEKKVSESSANEMIEQQFSHLDALHRKANRKVNEQLKL
ncbi:MAG: hypothetical protein GF364_16970, partial [Candidatus Lokiarchaeota archaeon]|nr:hypothetical protein [Candidatus Lokiarchaeota archaeon]